MNASGVFTEIIAMELRNYQRKAIDAVYHYFQHHSGNPLVVMPTGTSKSVVLAEFLREALHQWPDTRVVVLTHVKELIQQNFNAMMAFWPEAPAGIYSAGLNRREIGAQIMFAGIQSVHRRAYDIQRCDLILIDEAHLLNKSATGMYRRFLNEVIQINPDLKIVGLTATPFRMDQGLLTEGEEALFTDIAIDISLLDMIDQGYLVPLIPKQTKTVIDVSGVHLRGGEFNPTELQAAVNTAKNNSGAVSEIVKAGLEDNRGSWLVFCSGVEHATAVRDEVRKYDITCETINGETPAVDRDRILREFKAGRIRCITNMNVLTTGFDAPGIDLIGMLRPTKSQSLYVQMLGRGTRLAEGKTECLVLDFAGNTRRHGPVDSIKASRPGERGNGEAPTKVCPECEMIQAIASMICPNCGYEFPEREIKIADIPDVSPILSTQVKSDWLKVGDVQYHKHQKVGKPPSLMVTYYTGIIRHREWICLQHQGYAQEKARSWWVRRMQRSSAPLTIDDALLYVKDLIRPSHIRVRLEGKYTSIVGYKFD